MSNETMQKDDLDALLASCREDFFIDPDCRILQNKKHFCFNSDSVDLAKFVRIHAGDQVCEIGTNNGAILVYLDRFKPERLTGIEILEEPAQIAKENMKQLKNASYEIFCGSVTDYPMVQFDVVLSNPPFFEMGDFEKKQLESGQFNSRQLARFEQNLDLAGLIEQASRLLRSYGRFYLVHRPERMVEAILEMDRHQLAPSRIQFVYDARDNQAKAVLIEAIKEGTSKAQILEPIFRGQ